MSASATRNTGIAVWILGLFLPLALNSAWVSVAAIFAIYGIVALSEDIILGRAGMFDMGHAVYFGIGAYVTAILNVTFNWPIFFTIPLAILLGLFNAFAAGYISSSWQDAITFALLIGILLVRPSGILGERVAEKV